MNARYFVFLFFPICLSGDSLPELVAKCCGRCVGSSNCTACTTCNYCKYCNSGGSCGVCGGGRSYTPKTYNKPRSTYDNYDNTYNNSSSGGSPVKTLQVQYFVNATILNVRSGPGIKFPITDKLGYGTKIKIDVSYLNGWCYIIYYDTAGFLSYGYVLKKHLGYSVI